MHADARVHQRTAGSAESYNVALSRGVDANVHLLSAATRGHPDVVAFLFSRGVADVHYRSEVVVAHFSI